MTVRYPEEEPTINEVAQTSGAFLITYTETDPVGRRAARLLDAGEAEIKWVYVWVKGSKLGNENCAVLLCLLDVEG